MFASIELLNLRHSKNSPLPARSPFLEQLTNQIIWRCKRPKVKSLRLLCPISFKIIYGPIANEVDSHKMRWRFFWAARREQKSLDTNRSRVSRAWKRSLHTRCAERVGPWRTRDQMIEHFKLGNPKSKMKRP